MQSLASGNRPYDLAVSPDGRYLYAFSSLDSTLTAYSISPTDGTLTASGSTLGISLGGQRGLMSSPNGHFLLGASTSVINTISTLTTPSDTLSTALNIGGIASVNSAGSGIFGQLPLPMVYSPALGSAPSNWTLTAP